MPSRDEEESMPHYRLSLIHRVGAARGSSDLDRIALPLHLAVTGTILSGVCIAGLDRLGLAGLPRDLIILLSIAVSFGFALWAPRVAVLLNIVTVFAWLVNTSTRV